MAGIYRDNSSSAEENRSSGFALLGAGLIGVVFVVLGMTNVIPIKMVNPYLFYGIICALIALFLVMGFISLLNARKYEKKAKSEKGIKDSLIEWSVQHFKPEEIDSFIPDLVSASEEEKYFARCEVISAVLKKQFINLNPEMLEDLIDKTIYDKIFGACS